MFSKKILLIIFILFSMTTHLFSHAAPVKLFVKTVENDFLNVHARLGLEGQFISGVKVRLISVRSNKTLEEKILPKKNGVTFKIPTESYIIVLKSKGKKIILDGPAPKSGFTIIAHRSLYAFKTTLTLCIFFIILALFIVFKRKNKVIL